MRPPVGAEVGRAYHRRVPEPRSAYDSTRYIRINRRDTAHLGRVSRHLAPAPGSRVLEVGCGRGFLTRDMHERLGLDVTGTDLNPNVIERAVTDRVLSMPATALDFPDETFDHVVTVHTIEHVPAIATAFREMSRVLRPGGTMLAVYPAEPIQGLFAIPTAVILHGNPFKAREVHCHRLTPGRVRALAEPVGLTETRHEFSFFATPQFTSVFAKV